MVDGGWQMVDGGWQMVDVRHPSSAIRHPPSDIHHPSGSKNHELDHLCEIEARMADHRADHRSATQVDDPPEGAERGRRDRDVMSLFEMAESEEDAEDDEPGCAAAKVLLESPQHERPLNLLAHAAGDHRDQC